MSELIFIAVPGARPGKLRVVVLPGCRSRRRTTG